MTVIAAPAAQRISTFFFNPTNGAANSSSAPPLTNAELVALIASPANNFLTTNSNLTVRGAINATGQGQEPWLSFVQMTVNTNTFHAAILATNFSDALVPGPGGIEQAMTRESVSWSSNITLVPGANVITVQSVNTNGQTNLSVPASRTVFYVTSLPSALVQSSLTMQTTGHGKITGLPGRALLEINKVYTVKAAPAADWIFTNWTSGTNTNSLTALSASPTLSFIMSSNLILQANFVTNPFPALAGVYNGLFAPTNGVAEASSGFFTATLPAGGHGTYSAKLLLDGASYPFSGDFDLSGQAGQTVNRPGDTPLSVQLQLNLASSNSAMTGAVSDGAASNGWTALLRADRAFNPRANPAANYAGHYTIIIPPGDQAPANLPAGSGYAALAVNAGGAVSVSGRLADSTAFSQSVPVATNGDIPLYASLYSRQGSLQGWLVLTNIPANNPPQTILGSNLAWIKNSGAVSFTNTNIIVLGSFYLPPPHGMDILANLTNGTLILSNGGSAEVLTYHNVTSQGDKLAYPDSGNPTNQLQAVVAPGNGVVTLTFRPTGARADTTARGVVLQDQDTTNAAGWFIPAPGQSGSFLLQQ